MTQIWSEWPFFGVCEFCLEEIYSISPRIWFRSDTERKMQTILLCWFMWLIYVSLNQMTLNPRIVMTQITAAIEYFLQAVILHSSITIVWFGTKLWSVIFQELKKKKNRFLYQSEPMNRVLICSSQNKQFFRSRRYSMVIGPLWENDLKTNKSSW